MYGKDTRLRWFRLREASPSAWINTTAHSQSLRLELDAGANGPVLDRVRLRDAVVLVE